MVKILLLTLSKETFDTMLEGVKDRDYRHNNYTGWIKSRLVHSNGNPKEYDFVKFVNGYGRDKRYFICRYKGFEIARKNYTVSYCTGLTINVMKGQYRILLGKVLKKGNIYSKELF